MTVCRQSKSKYQSVLDNGNPLSHRTWICVSFTGSQHLDITCKRVWHWRWLADLIHFCVHICQLTHAADGHVRSSSRPMSDMFSSFYFKHCEKAKVRFHQQERVDVCRQDSGIPRKPSWTGCTQVQSSLCWIPMNATQQIISQWFTGCRLSSATQRNKVASVGPTVKGHGKILTNQHRIQINHANVKWHKLCGSAWILFFHVSACGFIGWFLVFAWRKHVPAIWDTALCFPHSLFSSWVDAAVRSFPPPGDNKGNGSAAFHTWRSHVDTW